MERDLAGARLSCADFDDLATLCAYDKRFPLTYEAWLSIVRKGDELADKSGWPWDPFDIDVADFAAWCRRAEVKPGFDALRAYAITHRRRREAAARASP